MAIEVKLLIPLVLVLLCFLGASCAQTLDDEMIKLLGGSNWSEAYSIAEANDGGYLIVGTDNSDGIGSENIWLVKTDSKGVTKWEKTFGISKGIGRYILRTNDDRYLVAGITELKDNIDLDALLIRINSTGGIDQIDREKEIGDSGIIDQVYSIIKTNDNNYIIVGEKESPETKHTGIWLTKIDENATEIWSNKLLDKYLFSWNETPGMDEGTLKDFLTQKFGIDWVKNAKIEKTDDNKTIKLFTGKNSTSLKLNDNEVILEIDDVRTDKFTAKMENDKLNIYPDNNTNRFGRSITQKADGSYLIAGYSSPPGSAQSDILLLEADSEGNLKNNANIYNLTKNLSILGLNKAFFINKTKDGYFIVGINESSGSDEKDSWIVKFFENGIIDWNYSFNDKGYNAARSAIETDDGGYVIVGSTNFNDHGSLDAWIAKIDSNGSLEWSRALGGAGYDIGNSVLQTDDGGFLVAGVTGSYGNRTLNGWLVEVNSSGYEEWNTTLGLPVTPVVKQTIPEKLNATAVEIDKHYTNPFLNFLYLWPIKWFLIGLGFYVFYKLLQILKSIYFKRELVIEDFVNASADDSFKDSITGLREQMTERVINKLDSFGEILTTHKEDIGPKEFRGRPELIYSPKEAQVSSIKDMADSLKELAPDKIKPLMALISVIFPKRQGVKISCSLQGHKDQSDILGITVRLSENRDSEMTMVQTFWEPKSKPKIETSLDKCEREKLLNAISQYLWEAGFYSDSIKYLKEGLELCESSEEKISKYYQEQEKIELARIYYNKAKKYLDLGKIGDAKRNYDLSLAKLKNHAQTNSYYWNNNISFLDLAKLYKDSGLIDEAIELLELAIGKNYKGEKESECLKKFKARRLLEAGKLLQKLARDSEAGAYLETSANLSPQDQEIKNASEQVKAAIKKQKKTYDRFKELMDSASFWSAIEVCKWTMLDSKKIHKYPSLKKKDKFPYIEIYLYQDTSYLAEVNLFCGILKLSYAIKGNPEFYKLAKMDFERARNFCPSWYRPHSYLGDMYSFEARSSSEKQIEKAREAIISYESALKMLNEKNNIEKISDQLKSRDYLTINLVIAQLLAGNIKLAKKFSEKPCIENYLKGSDMQYMGYYYLKGEHSARTLYNYACLLGLTKSILTKQGFIKYTTLDNFFTIPKLGGIMSDCIDSGLVPITPPNDRPLTDFEDLSNTAIKYSKVLLVYSMGRDRYNDILKIIDSDPDLMNVICSNEINDLKFKVQLERVKNPKLYECKIDELKKYFRDILPK